MSRSFLAVNYILLIDDEESIRLLLSKILRTAGYEVGQAPEGDIALAMIAAREPDLVVLDLSMPGLSGLEVCRRLKSNPFTSRIPVLMLTAQSEIDWKLQGFDAGADDYLGKPFDPREVVARAHALLRLVKREGDRNPSSGLPGGRAIRDEIERRAATGQAFCICYLDIDGFKPFADTFGFSVADQTIEATGDALREAARQLTRDSFLGHIGGDDFLAVAHPDDAESLAHDCSRRFQALVARILGEDVAQQGRFTGIDREGRVRNFPLPTLSGVVLCIEPGHWTSANHLGAFAADLKRQAKAQGGGTILVRTL